MTSDGPLLALDTATRTPVLAVAGPEGRLRGERHWQSQHRHGERLLQELDALLADLGVGKRDLRGVVVGTGPGSFTGLRIGLATAKVLAYSLDLPIVGISTTHAIGLASSTGGGDVNFAISLPAGVADRYVHRLTVTGKSVAEAGPPALVAGAEPFKSAVAGSRLVAVDLDGDDIPPDAVERGRAALTELGGALARLGATALREGRADDVATLIPAYVALPRGIAAAAAEMTWSPDLR